MSGGLASSSWFRIAPLRPRWRSHVQVHRHRYRGAVWYVVEDRISAKFHRFDPAAYRVVSQLDGRHTLQQIWDALAAEQREDGPSQQDIVQLIGQLNAADLIVTEASVDVAELFERQGKQQRQKLKSRFANPLSLRFPLLDPDRFLTLLHQWLGAVPRWLVWALWLAVVAPAALQVPVHWAELTGNFGERLLAADNLALLAVAFMAMKVFHELAHGWALKARGAEVHEMGVMLLLFYPVPYVDASNASALVRKSDRIVIGAAGMVIEIWLAALAFFVWTVVEPGLLRSLLYNLLVVGSVSTVIFNANPLLRYDGYYMLADAIEVPNLGQRANGWWLHLLRRHGFGISAARAPQATTAERRWFIAYAPTALAYRLFVTLSIAWIVGQQYFFVGVLMGAWAIASGIAWPLARGYARLAADPQATSRAGRVAAVALGGPMLVLALLFVLPLPHHTRTHGVVSLPERAVLRAGTDGFVQTLQAQPGQQLAPGDLVLHSTAPQLQADRNVQAAKVAEMQARLDAVWGLSPTKAGQMQGELAREQTALQRLDLELQRLDLRAQVAGQLLIDQPRDLPGRHLRQGDPVGYVVGQVVPLLRVVVPQHEVDTVRNGTRAISVRLPQAFSTELTGRLVRAVPKGGRSLPSATLGRSGGGDISVDPRERGGAQALETVFEFEVELPGQEALRHLGSRAFVAFEHAPEPLGWRLWRLLRRQLLSVFQW